MEHDISRGIDKIISWLSDITTNIIACFLFLVTSTTITFAVMSLVKAFTVILSKSGLEVPYPDSPFLIYIIIIFCFMALYSRYVELKFVKPSWSCWVILIVIIFIICVMFYWLMLPSGPLQGDSLVKLSTCLGVLLYIFLWLMFIPVMMQWSLMSALLLQTPYYRHRIKTPFKHARSAVDKLAERYDAEKCLFGWGDIPGEDEEKLASYLRKDHDIDWVDSKNIYKSDDGKTIHVSNDKNTLKITIDEKKEKGTLEINNARIYGIKVKKENDKLNIYEVNKDMYGIHTVSENYKRGINEVKDLLGRGIDLDRNPSLCKVLDQLAFWMQYYLFYGGSEQIESVKKHLDHITKNFDRQYRVNLDKFIYEILRMHDEMDDYFEKNKIHPVRSTKFVDRLKGHLLKKSPEVLALIIIALLIHLSGSLSEIIKLFQQILQYFII